MGINLHSQNPVLHFKDSSPLNFTMKNPHFLFIKNLLEVRLGGELGGFEVGELLGLVVSQDRSIMRHYTCIKPTGKILQPQCHCARGRMRA